MAKQIQHQMEMPPVAAGGSRDSVANDVIVPKSIAIHKSLLLVSYIAFCLKYPCFAACFQENPCIYAMCFFKRILLVYVAINCNPGPHCPGIGGLAPGFNLLLCDVQVQPRVLPRTVGDLFLVNPRVGPRPITPDAFGQSPGICGHLRGS